MNLTSTQGNHTDTLNLNGTTGVGDRPQLGQSSVIKVINLIAYPLVLFLSTFGNLLVFIIVYRHYKRKRLKNYFIFILNLAISDFLAAWIFIPINLPFIALDITYWIYGEFVCHTSSAIVNVCFYASVLTLVAVSLSRYQVIAHPLSGQLSNKQTVWICLAVWGISLISRIPEFIVTKLDETQACLPAWEEFGMNEDAFVTTNFVLTFITPLLIMIVCYILILKELSTRTKIKCNRSEARQIRERWRVTKMLIVATSVFVVLVSPVNFVWMWITYGSGGSFKYIIELNTILSAWAFIHAATNPFCYTLCNASFRREAKSVLLCKEAEKMPRNTRLGMTNMSTIPSFKDTKKQSNKFNLCRGTPSPVNTLV